MENEKTPSLSPQNEHLNPDLIPNKRLYTGAKIPVIGLGTFGSDRYSGTEIAAAVKDAALSGYRHFDCAAVYGNEELIGTGFKEIISRGIQRDELWITSKLWNDQHAEKDVIPACKKSLHDLKLDYLDLYLVHWPFPNFHPPQCDHRSRSPNARPYLHENYMQTWSRMEQLVEMGLVRHIGTSNLTIPKMKLVLRDAKIKPACEQLELHPHFQQPDYFKFLIDHNILPIGYSPIGTPYRPQRDRTPEDTVDIEDPVIVKIARRLTVHPAVICIKWAVQHGHIPIPFSVHRRNYMANLQGVISPPLTDEDMQDIAAIDRNCRLIKGHVFLWKEGQTWEDLWDLNGDITPP